MDGPHSNSTEAGRKSSLDALSRTIDGLEARIESLVSRRSSGAGERSATHSAGDDPIAASHRRATDEILERQHLLDRERANLEARLALRRPARAAEAASAGSEVALREIAESLVGLRDELKNDFSDSLTREIAALREEIKTLSASGAQPLPVSMRDDLLRLSESIERLGQRGPAGGDPDLSEEIQSLRLAIEVFAGAAERNWSAVEQRLQEVDPQTLRAEIAGLAQRLEGIKDAIEILPAGTAADEADSRLKAVASALETLAEQVNLDDAAVDHRFAGMAERLDEISRAIVSLGSKADRSEDTATLGRIETRMEGLSRQMAAFGDHDPVAELADRLGALMDRVDMLASEEAVASLAERLDQLSFTLERGQAQAGETDLTERLIEISGKIDALDQGAINTALAERLDDLAHRIDGIAGGMEIASGAMFDRFETLVERAETSVAAPVRLPGLEVLEERLVEIARRLDETQSPAAGNDALRSLESQLAHLSDLIGRPGYYAEGGDTPLEPRLAVIEEHLATNDEYVIEAARQAAEAVVEAYALNRGAAGGVQTGELAVMAELAEDLRALEEVSQRSEERTARAFDAVHDTLVKIAEHLEKLGDVRDGAATAFEAPADDEDAPRTADEQDDAAVMLSHAPSREDDGEERFEHDRLAEATLPPQEPALQHAAVEAASADDAEAGGPANEPGRRGFLASLGRRIRPSRSEPVMGDEEIGTTAAARADVGDAPSIDPADSLEPVSLNEPLEPGSGAPDINRIMQKVREVQNARGEAGGDKTDFIAAARRAAQAAAAEVETMEGAKKRKGTGLASLIRRRRRPILMAIGAVLLAVMSWPLVSAFLSGPETSLTSEAAVKPATVTEKSDVAMASSPPVSPETTAATAGPNLPKVHVVDEKADERAAATPADVPAKAAGHNESAEVASVIPAPDIAEAAPAEAAKPTSANPASSSASASPSAEAESDAAEAKNSPAVAKTDANEPAAPIAVAMAVPSAVPAVPAAIGPQSLRSAAEKGEPAALFEIGARYTQGRDVDVNLAEAAKWYKAAADRGLAPAEYRLANFYEKGSGVDRDVDAARAWYRKAADQGNASAMHNLAVLYAMGKDGKPDYEAAAEWFRKAADHGVKDSQFNLAILYAQGRGVPRDLVQSYKWFAIAAADGDHDATEKRDQVAAALKPDELKKARAEVSEWKPEPLDPAANNVAVPPEWSGTDTRTASIDMTKAIRNIQAILDNNGFNAGKPDGIMGDKTRSAIKAFQKSIGQEATGEIDDALIKQLLALNRKQQGSKAPSDS